MARLKKIGLLVALIAALGTAGYFVWRFGVLESVLASFEKQNQFVEPPPPVVTVAYPVEQYVHDTIELTGTTRAKASVDLKARITGYLKEVHFHDGKMVNKGDLLFVIEPEPFLVAKQAAEARLEKAEATLQLAQANLTRIEGLYRRNAATKQEYDVQMAERSSAAAEVSIAKAQVAQAELDLTYTEILAPMSGRISRHLVDPGNLVRAEETMLASIQGIDEIHAYFYLSELQLLQFMDMLRQNEIPDPETEEIKIRMGLANDTSFPYEGKLDYRETSVDPETGTIERRAIFKNEDKSLIPGLFVRLRGNIGAAKPRLLVPDRAIGSDQKGDFLLVVNNQDTVEQRTVKLGISIEDMRVILEGIQAGDRVVVNGLQRARPGTVVDAQFPEDATSAPGPAESGEGPLTETKPTDQKATKPQGKAG